MPEASSEITPRYFALIAGFGLLVMVFSAPVANFQLIPSAVIAGDIPATISNLRNQSSGFLLGVLLLFVTYLMDIVVAWALFYLFVPSKASLSLLVAWSRLVYTALALVGLWMYLSAYNLALATTDSELSKGVIEVTVLNQLSAAKTMESMALLLFGVHLCFLSILLWRSPLSPSWLSIPVALAAVSYVLMFLGKYFAPNINLGWLLLLALGELVFMVWLLIYAWRNKS